MARELSLPATVERRNKLDISLGYCSEIDPRRLLSLGPAREVRLDDPAQVVDFVLHDAEEDRVHFVNHLRSGDKEWEYVCFVRHGQWTLFSSVFSTALAYNPTFADGQRRRLACGGTRIIAKRSLEMASHHALDTPEAELLEALKMDLFLSEAMTGKNLSNGFNIGGSKSLVYVGPRDGQQVVAAEHVRELARFMAQAHVSITQSLPVFIGTGSDLNFHEHGESYYDLCSRYSPNYFGNRVAGARWGRVTSGNTTEPTARGVIACIDAVAAHLGLEGERRSILVKGLGGVGSAVAARYAGLGWRVHASEVSDERRGQVARELGSAVTFVDEKDWGSLSGVTIFSPNSSSASVTRDNLPLLAQLGVETIVGGENNILEKGLDPDVVYRDHGILTFADFLVNGGGAWIVGAEMVERPVGAVERWTQEYQVPTVIQTIELARETGRSPESLFRDFIAGKVRELLA